MSFAASFSFGNLQATGSILFAVLCALIAASKGRSALGWAIGGFFLQCFALIFVLCLGDADHHAEEEAIGRRHRRRMDERVRREAVKLERLKQEVRGRLDAHDIATGIDTRAIRKPLNLRARTADTPVAPCWYYEDHGNPAGPIGTRPLLALIQAGEVLPQTLVWKEGMSEWAPAESLVELS